MAGSASKKKKPTRKTGKSWKRNRGEDLELPSGNVALVKRPGPAALLNADVMPDTLMPIVQKAIKEGKGMKPEVEADLIKDPTKIAEMLDAMDKLLVVVVVDPKPIYHKHQIKAEVSGPPEKVITQGDAYATWETIPDDLRNGEECPSCHEQHPDDDEAIYTDEVDLDDKLFIFNYAVGGTRDLERFRKEYGARLGALSSGEGTEAEAVGPDSGSGGGSPS